MRSSLITVLIAILGLGVFQTIDGAVCSTQTGIRGHTVRRLRLRIYGGHFRKRKDNQFDRNFTQVESSNGNWAQRSIIQCASSVEVLSVQNDATVYSGVALSGVVTLVETLRPLTNAIEIAQTALPACSGIFISSTKILTSAHCVFHQRQRQEDLAHWMFGDKSPQQTYLYAIASRVDGDDDTFTVYGLRRACIPSRYVNAENEAATSTQQSDFAVLETTGRFTGEPRGLGTLAKEIEMGEVKDYMLMQYPSDVGSGRQLVIDRAKTAIQEWPLNGGIFHTVDLASWSGSSGGPIIDIEKSKKMRRPVVVGVLMSSGLEVCDSGIVPLTDKNKELRSMWISVAREKDALTTEQDDSETFDNEPLEQQTVQGISADDISLEARESVEVDIEAEETNDFIGLTGDQMINHPKHTVEQEVEDSDPFNTSERDGVANPVLIVEKKPYREESASGQIGKEELIESLSMVQPEQQVPVDASDLSSLFDELGIFNAMPIATIIPTPNR